MFDVLIIFDVKNEVLIKVMFILVFFMIKMVFIFLVIDKEEDVVMVDV